MPNAVTLMGSPVLIEGVLPRVGEHIPEFTLVDKNLEDVTLDNFAGKRKVLNIFPSIDTPTCASSVRRFNQLASGMKKIAEKNPSVARPTAAPRISCTLGCGIRNAPAPSRACSSPASAMAPMT